jgi:hypothetical protein
MGNTPTPLVLSPSKNSCTMGKLAVIFVLAFLALFSSASALER